MTSRSGVWALAALMVLGRVELTGQRPPAEPPIRQIDHVMIKADDPRRVFAFFTETLGLPIAWPLEERGGVVSGGVGFGNVNIEAIRFPGQKSLPLPAQLTGFGFEPSPLRACLDELQRRGVPYGPLRPLTVTDSTGAKQTLFTNVTLLGLSDTALPVDATLHIFLSEYSPTYVHVAGRHARIREELVASGGGPLGVESMREVVVGTPDVATMRARWQQLLSPVPAIDGAWQIGTGPAIRTVPAKEHRVEELVVRVKSLARTKAFLQANGLLAAGTAAEVALNASRAFGIKMRFVE